MSRPARFGVTLPQIKRSWEEARDAALEFDALGYHSAWVCDHVYGVPRPDVPIFEAWTELAAVGALAWRYVSSGRKLAAKVPDEEKYWA